MPYLVLAQMQYRSTTTSAAPLQTYRDRNTSKTGATTWQHAARRTRPHIWMPPTPFVGYQSANTYPQSHAVWSFTGQQYTDTVQSWLNYPARDTALIARLRDLAVTRALANLKDQKFNASQAIGEAQQTARLVASTATRLTKAIVACKSGNAHGLVKALGLTGRLNGQVKTNLQKLGAVAYKPVQHRKLLADTWLELQYGWKPLLSDVHGMAQDLAASDLQDPTRYIWTVRGRATDKSIRNVESINGSKHQFTRRNIQHGVQVVLSYSRTSAGQAALVQTGLSNPANLAWELTPFSFVADWFLPIGNYLQSLDADLGYSFIGGCHTSRFLVDLVHDRTTMVGFADRWVAFNPAKSQGDNFYCHGGRSFTKHVERQVYGSSPLPRFPGIKNPLSLSHAASALALLRGTVR